MHAGAGKMKYYIIAGEASGDLHGSHLIRELIKLDPAADFRGWGGDKMQQEGLELVKHYRDLAFMGFAEVLMNLRSIFRNLRSCKEDILRYKPDVLVLIDYPGFNLRIAKWAREQELFTGTRKKIIYYISPQVWAWKENRVKMMKQCIDKMLVILPFEKEYFRKKWDWEVEYVGHPLVEVIQSAVNSRQSTVGSQRLSGKPIIALLPGSRKQEISKKLPVMLEVSRSFPGHQFIVAKAPGANEELYASLLKGYENVSSVSGKTYELLMQTTAALVTSGTATLETALFGVPQVVCYKSSFLSYQVGRRVIRVKYISLVNLIMDKLVVHELIQNDLTAENLQKELEDILNNPLRKEELRKDYAELKQILSVTETGNNKGASAKAAASIIEEMNPH